MKAVAVDDEPISLDCMEVVLKSLKEIEEVHTFSNGADTINWLKTNTVDIAFLDIEMWDMNGLELAAKIRKMQTNCRIVFVTSSPKYAVDAFQLHVSGYIIKPITKEAVKKELKYIQENQLKKEMTSAVSENQHQDDNEAPAFEANGQAARIQVQCFGNFTAFVNNMPVKFHLSKAKELFAYLVHRRGAACTVGELAAILYEEKSTIDSNSVQSQLRNVISSLKKTLEDLHVDDVLVKTRGNLSIVPAKIDCDYYEFLKGNLGAINSYSGEYMAQYSWAEFTVGYLEKMLNN